MYKIAVMGDYDSIYGFAMLGLTIFPVKSDNKEEAGRILKTLAEGEYGIIYITEELAKTLESEIENYSGALTPAIIRIPGVHGNTGDGVRLVKKSVEQAVGSDILFGND